MFLPRSCIPAFVLHLLLCWNLKFRVEWVLLCWGGQKEKAGLCSSRGQGSKVQRKGHRLPRAILATNSSLKIKYQEKLHWWLVSLGFQHLALYRPLPWFCCENYSAVTSPSKTGSPRARELLLGMAIQSRGIVSHRWSQPLRPNKCLTRNYRKYRKYFFFQIKCSSLRAQNGTSAVSCTRLTAAFLQSSLTVHVRRQKGQSSAMAAPLMGLGHQGLSRSLQKVWYWQFTPVLNLKAKCWEQPVRLTIRTWSDKPWYRHTVKFQNDAVDINFLTQRDAHCMPLSEKKEATKQYVAYDSTSIKKCMQKV